MKRPSITDKMKLQVLRDHGAIVPCGGCSDAIKIDEIDYDHHRALIDDGEHDVSNLRPICRKCHTAKSAREHRNNAKCKRVAAKHNGTFVKKGKKIPARPFPEQSRPFPSRKLSGQTERR